MAETLPARNSNGPSVQRSARGGSAPPCALTGSGAKCYRQASFPAGTKTRRPVFKKLLSILIVLALVVPLAAQKKPKDSKIPPAAPVAAKQEPPAPPAKPGEAEPKPYDKVITPEFTTQTGRLQEHEAILGPKAYAVAELLTDLRAGVFGELIAEAVKVDPYRRNLQRDFVTALGARLSPPPAAAMGAAAAPTPANDDSRGAIRAELKALKSLLQTRVEGAADKATRNHVEDLIDQITVILDPRGAAR